MSNPSTPWKVQQRPALLTRRFDFSSYDQTRQFLDDLTVLSERAGYFPDLNFGKTHASVSVASGGDSLGAREYEFAAQVDVIAAKLANQAS